MASRRTCISALRRPEAFLSPKTGTSSSSSLPKFSRQSSHWTCPAPRHINGAEQRPVHFPRTFNLTPSPILRIQRPFSSSPAFRHGDLDTPKPGEERTITFIDKENQSHTFTVADGANLLDIAQHYDLEMEGACGGSCACSTCHVIVEDEEYYNKMDEPDDDENDMLDLAFGLTETSRLGCQVVMSKELSGIVVKLPRITRNLQASDFAD
ncbi:ferredoxin, partial [Phaeosphaeriaceae sp. SRC1lsM3a]